jgi:integrase
MTDKRKVFHSFRHTVKKKMRDAGVDKTLRDAVMGHTAEDEAERYGRDEDGQGFSLVPLSQAIEAISFP